MGALPKCKDRKVWGVLLLGLCMCLSPSLRATTCGASPELAQSILSPPYFFNVVLVLRGGGVRRQTKSGKRRVVGGTEVVKPWESLDKTDIVVSEEGRESMCPGEEEDIKQLFAQVQELDPVARLQNLLAHHPSGSENVEDDLEQRESNGTKIQESQADAAVHRRPRRVLQDDSSGEYLICHTEHERDI